MVYRVFISHGGADILVADRVLRNGIESLGASAFLDAAALALGDEFRRLVFDELAAADELLVLLTPTSIRRPWIFAEIGAMMALQKRIVAINYGVDEERA